MRALIVKAAALLGLCGVFAVSWNCWGVTGIFFSTYYLWNPCECTPRSFDLGQVSAGSVTEVTFSLRNSAVLQKKVRTDPDEWRVVQGVSPTLKITGFSSTQCESADLPFRVTGTFPVVLEKDEVQEFTIEFAPTTQGAWQCDLKPDYEYFNVGYNVDGVWDWAEACSVHVSGSAVPGPGPSCALQPVPPEFHYGEVVVGTWGDLTLTIHNETPDPLTTNQFKYVLENPAADCRVFTIDPADTARVIGPGESWDIAVRFAPDGAGDFKCTRSLASLKEPANPADPYIANACPTTVTWRGTGVVGAPVWSNCAPGGNNDWHGVSGLSASEIYVAGNGGSVIASGGDCQWVASGTVFSDVNLRDIWAYSDGASTVAWAVGNIPPPPGTFGETGAVLRMDGALWYKVDEGIFVTYGAVWGSAFDDVYFVGTGVATDFPNAKHWNGTVFDTLHISPMGMSEVSGVSGNAANDIWAVLRQQWNSVYHYDGSQWTDETQPWMTKALHDVWTVAGTGFYHAYAVGEDGAIYHFDGTHWTDESIPGETRDFYGVWVSQTGQVFVVGEGSVIYHSDGNNNWTQQTPSNVQGDLMDVWGDSDSDVYAVGTNGLILRYAPPGP